MRTVALLPEPVPETEVPAEPPKPPKPKPVVGKHRTFQPAKAPLTDADIRRRYGSLIGDALGHFVSDPAYVVEMTQAASLVAYRKEEQRLRAQLLEEGVPPAQVAAQLAELLAARGIHRPKARSSRVRRRT